LGFAYLPAASRNDKPPVALAQALFQDGELTFTAAKRRKQRDRILQALSSTSHFETFAAWLIKGLI